MNSRDLGPLPRLFVLVRHADPTGVSGTGVVADGMVFPDGRVVSRWRGTTTGVAQFMIWDRLADVTRIHGHGGRTEIVWVEREDPVRRLPPATPPSSGIRDPHA